MELSNFMNRDRVEGRANQGKGRHTRMVHKRLSQREQRIEEFLKRVEAKLRRADRGLE